MFQENAWTGLLFWAGILWGAYAGHTPTVAWGAIVAVIVSTLSGYVMGVDTRNGLQGLWGFNGVLVGCAFPTFLGNTWQMWVALIICSAATTWVRRGFNNVMTPWKVNSLTFPFVFLTWIFLLSARYFQALDPSGLSEATLALKETTETLDMSFGALATYWLKGISQVFLIDSWVTGIFFLVALAVSNWRAAVWAAVGSALALAVSIAFGLHAATITGGLFGFSAVLTGIALGCTFYKPNLRASLWALMGIVTTQFVQMGMDAMMLPFGLPTLTGPFCITTWLFLLPRYKLDDVTDPDLSDWEKSNLKPSPEEDGTI